jgi:hypothetical protein
LISLFFVCNMPGTFKPCQAGDKYCEFLCYAGSIPDEVITLFNLPNLSSRTMALVSTQPLTEMSTRNLPGAKGWPARKADNLTAICVDGGTSTSYHLMGLRGLVLG